MSRGLATFHLPVNVSPLYTLVSFYSSPPELFLSVFSRVRSPTPTIASHLLVLNLSTISCVCVCVCVCVCFSVSVALSLSLSLCEAEECVCCRSSVREMWGECRQVWGIACESASAHRSD